MVVGDGFENEGQLLHVDSLRVVDVGQAEEPGLELLAAGLVIQRLSEELLHLLLNLFVNVVVLGF